MALFSMNILYIYEEDSQKNCVLRVYALRNRPTYTQQRRTSASAVANIKCYQRY